MLCVLPLLAGCGGAYQLTAPDQIAPAGGEATAVVRLRRQEVWILSQSVDNALLRFRVNDGPMRAAYTDKLGYAGTTVPVPDLPCRCEMVIEHMDRRGDEAAFRTPLYVWDPQWPVLAVDLDSLPSSPAGEPGPAAAGLQQATRGAHIAYFTRRPVREHAAAHGWLETHGYPDGPVLLWQRERWHVVQGRWKLPKIVVETRLVSELPELRKQFPTLTRGVCTSGLAAAAYREAGLQCIVIGSDSVGGDDAVRYGSWEEFGRSVTAEP